MKLAEHWRILIGLISGALVGWVLNTSGADSSVFGFVGDFFLRALKLIIVPLIFSSIVTGIAGLGSVEGFGRLGLKTVSYYAMTSLCAIIIGLTVVNLIQPGLVDGQPNAEIVKAIESQSEEDLSKAKMKMGVGEAKGMAVVGEIFLRMIPSNFLKAASDNGQLLGLIFVSLLTAFGLVKLEGEGKGHLVGFFKGLNDLMLLITRWVMLFAPIGVFGLVAETVADTGFGLFASLAKYFMTVVLALLLHLFVVMPLILKFFGRISPLKHFQAMKEALVTAFSTASSSATLPVSMRCIQQNAGASKRVTSFVLPLGATVNMDGTALYECVAVLFIGQVLGQPMDIAQQFLVVILALLTSIGVAGVPSASLVAIVIILNNVGIQGAAGAIGIILAVDRVLDMTRTAVNVFSDSCGAVIIAKSEGEDLNV